MLGMLGGSVAAVELIDTSAVTACRSAPIFSGITYLNVVNSRLVGQVRTSARRSQFLEPQFDLVADPRLRLRQRLPSRVRRGNQWRSSTSSTPNGQRSGKSLSGNPVSRATRERAVT